MQKNTVQSHSPIKSNSHFLIFISFVLIIILYLASTNSLEPSSSHPKLNVFKMMFISIIIEAIPFILIGVLISAILQVFVTEKMIKRVIPKNPFLGILMASVLGIIFPICECGIVPAIHKLVKKGMPLYVATTFILVGPILNPIVFLSTLTAFRGQPIVAYARMGLAFAVALIIGLIVYKFVKSNQLREEATPNQTDHHHLENHIDTHELHHSFLQACNQQGNGSHGSYD